MSKTIEILISLKGETTVTTKGFVGSDCREASKFLEEALGQRAGERLTAEFHHNHEVNQTNQQQT